MLGNVIRIFGKICEQKALLSSTLLMLMVVFILKQYLTDLMLCLFASE